MNEPSDPGLWIRSVVVVVCLSGRLETAGRFIERGPVIAVVRSACCLSAVIRIEDVPPVVSDLEEEAEGLLIRIGRVIRSVLDESAGFSAGAVDDFGEIVVALSPASDVIRAGRVGVIAVGLVAPVAGRLGVFCVVDLLIVTGRVILVVLEGLTVLLELEPGDAVAPMVERLSMLTEPGEVLGPI